MGGDPGEHVPELGERASSEGLADPGPVAGFVHRCAPVCVGGGAPGAASEARLEPAAQQSASLSGERHLCAERDRTGWGETRQYRYEFALFSIAE